MKTVDAITGGATGVGLAPIMGDFSTQMGALNTNITNRLREAGVDTTSITSPGKLATVLSEEGYPNVARLIAAILLAQELIVRSFGKYAGGDGFSEVIDDEFKDFPNKPEVSDLDTILSAVGGEQQATPTTLQEKIMERLGGE